MSMSVLLAAATSVIGLVFAVALLDQYRSRRHTFQIVWALGMLFYGIAAGCEAIAAASGWNETLYRTYYLTGAVWSVAWLGLGTAYLLARTRFGYAFSASLFLAGLFTFLTDARYHYPDSGLAPGLYFAAAAALAVAVAVDTYFESHRWPVYATVAVAGATLLSLVLMLTTALPAPGYQLDPTSHQPVFDLLPGTLRLLTPYMNVTGAFSLLLGAVFSTYVFMPKRRVLPYSLDPTQPGDQFLFNLLLAPVAITVNLVGSLPGAARALVAGNLHSRVPSTILIAIGAFIPTVTDSASRFGDTGLRELGHFLAIVFIFAGFLVSIEVFADIRVPFTGMVLFRRRVERPFPDEAPGGGAAAGAAH
ncbi:MAG TPA: hypothetical protein VN800_07485 [Candidatus Acidoferrales bacterium]|nr:hypothetical protein [Candidatus Acidoferrales bacterium]